METNPPKPGTPEYQGREKAFHAQARKLPGCGDRPRQAESMGPMKPMRQKSPGDAGEPGDYFPQRDAVGPDAEVDSQASLRPGAVLITPEAVELLIQRRPICDGCPHYNGLCVLEYPAARDRCQEWKDRMAAVWLPWLTNASSRCPAGLWGPRQAQLAAPVETDTEAEET